jgi:hypothetical protein
MQKRSRAPAQVHDDRAVHMHVFTIVYMSLLELLRCHRH